MQNKYATRGYEGIKVDFETGLFERKTIHSDILDMRKSDYVRIWPLWRNLLTIFGKKIFDFDACDVIFLPYMVKIIT